MVLKTHLNIEHTTSIACPAGRVWSELIRFDTWHEWNPMVRRASGTAETGLQTRVWFKSSLGLLLPFQIKILKAEDQELVWQGNVLGVLGVHYFRIQGREKGCSLVHGMDFTGGLVALAGGLIRYQTERSFLNMNQALKERCESD
jgi:hypothetical protein